MDFKSSDPTPSKADKVLEDFTKLLPMLVALPKGEREMTADKICNLTRQFASPKRRNERPPQRGRGARAKLETTKAAERLPSFTVFKTAKKAYEDALKEHGVKKFNELPQWKQDGPVGRRLETLGLQRALAFNTWKAEKLGLDPNLSNLDDIALQDTGSTPQG